MQKYADDVKSPETMIASPENIAREQQKANFAHELQMKMRAVMAEIGHDINVLKERGFDKEMQKLLVEVYNQVQNVFKTFTEKNPFETARQLSAYVNNRHTKAIISNLEFLSEHHIKKTNVSYAPSKWMQNPEARGLRLLLDLTDYVSDQLKTQDPQNAVPTYRPPSKPDLPAIPNIPEAPVPSI